MRQGLLILLSVFLVTFLALGCSALTTESETDAGPGLPASVSMDPSSFLTADEGTGLPVVCADLAGAMQSYVATITDVTNADAPFPLPSSPPLPCTQSAYFDYIGLGHVYTGVIDGYLEPASELVPVCGIAGPSVACSTDAECPVAFGCGGACNVNVWDRDVSACLSSCDVDLACLAKANNCVATSVADHINCLKNCAKECTATPPTNCEEGKLTVQQCVQNAGVDCIAPDFSMVGHGCAATGAPTLNDGPGGSAEPAGVKGCVCEYTTSVGERHVVAKKNGQPVYPRWTTDPSEPCGHYPYQAATQSYLNTPLMGCGLLQDFSPGSSATAIQLDPQSSLAGTGLVCGTSATTGADAGASDPVTSFDVTPADPSLAPYLGVACSAGKTVSWSQGLVEGGSYTFALQAYQLLEGTTATQQASCVATVEAGVTVLAMCDPLVPIPAPLSPAPASKAKPAPKAKPAQTAKTAKTAPKASPKP